MQQAPNYLQCKNDYLQHKKNHKNKNDKTILQFADKTKRRAEKIEIKTKNLTRLAMFTALALIMSLLESMLPPLISVLPGAKMGLSNVVTLAAIILLGYPQAVVVQLTRCILGGIITGGISGLMFSLPAGLLSLAVMIALYHFAFPKVSLLGISFCAAVVHNITQVFVACLLIDNLGFLTMLPYYIVMGIGAGLFVGIVCFFAVKYLPKRVYLR